jgi:aryl-alcohol dehydrogenase-like predicted oxidoreductase
MEAEMKDCLGVALSRRRALGFSTGLGAALLVPGWETPARAQADAGSLLTRPIPQSGEALPVIGLGTSIVFDIGDDPAERGSRAAVIRSLVAAGGKLIDTAPSYGRSEGVVGDLVAAAGLRRSVFLATKLEYYDRGTGPEQLRASLRRLHTDKVDLMQLHNISDRQQDLAMLREWKAQGLCRYTGITTTVWRDFDAAEAVLRREQPDFLQIDYSLEDREAEKRLIPAAVEVGAAVLTALPFGRGRVFSAVLRRPLPEWARQFGAASWGQFFLKYLLGNPAVTAVIPGTSNPEHMADNLGAGRGRLPDAAERRKMVEFFATLG